MYADNDNNISHLDSTAPLKEPYTAPALILLDMGEIAGGIGSLHEVDGTGPGFVS